MIALRGMSGVGCPVWVSGVRCWMRRNGEGSIRKGVVNRQRQLIEARPEPVEGHSAAGHWAALQSESNQLKTEIQDSIVTFTL